MPSVGQLVTAPCHRCGRLFTYRYKSGPVRTLDAACRKFAKAHHDPRKTTDRGYGSEHRNNRARLLPAAYGNACPLCGVVMQPWHRLDLDHSIPLAYGGTVGDRIVHAYCNRARGGRQPKRKRQGALK